MTRIKVEFTASSNCKVCDGTGIYSKVIGCEPYGDGIHHIEDMEPGPPIIELALCSCVLTTKKKSDDKVWKTKSGEKIPISNMTDDHILNTINYFRERYAYDKIDNIMLSKIHTGSNKPDLTIHDFIDDFINDSNDEKDEWLKSHHKKLRNVYHEAYKRKILDV